MFLSIHNKSWPSFKTESDQPNDIEISSKGSQNIKRKESYHKIEIKSFKAEQSEVKF